MCRPSAATLAVVALFGSLAAVTPARADIFDLSLHRLITPPAPGQSAAPDASSQIAYRQFTSELGVVMAPQVMAPADTLGYSGFQFTLDANFTTISANKCVPGETRDRCPWQYAVSGKDAAGVARDLPSLASTVSLTARKGIWLPIPSFELGITGSKLIGGEIYALQGYGKLALHEGFHDWPIPSLAVRGSVSRVLGAAQLDLTIAQVDTSVSKSFGLFGTATLVPYLGFAALFIIARGQVLDTTPNIDAYKAGPSSLDLNANAVFPDQDTIVRWRFFGGARLSYSVLVLALEYSITACGDFGGAPGNTCNHRDAKLADNAATQHTFSLSGGLLF